MGNKQPAKILFNPSDPDDYTLLADSELGTAPMDPGTYEGEDGKPRKPEDVLNKWCARECERSIIVDVHKRLVLPDFTKRVYNQPRKHTESGI